MNIFMHMMDIEVQPHVKRICIGAITHLVCYYGYPNVCRWYQAKEGSVDREGEGEEEAYELDLEEEDGDEDGKGMERADKKWDRDYLIDQMLVLTEDKVGV